MLAVVGQLQQETRRSGPVHATAAATAAQAGKGKRRSCVDVSIQHRYDMSGRHNRGTGEDGQTTVVVTAEHQQHRP